MTNKHSSPNTGSEGGFVTITVDLNESDWHGYGSESMWAEQLDDDKYQLRNVPFYVRGVSYDDIVIVKPDKGRLLVQQISQHNGHSTYRVFLSEHIKFGDSRFQKFWEPIESMGCTYERATERLFAVDVPPNADIHKVYDLLSVGEHARVWDFEEGHCGHTLAKPSQKGH